MLQADPRRLRRARQAGRRGDRSARPGPGFRLKPESLTAIQRAFAGVELAWWDYYRDNPIQGDERFAITKAALDARGSVVRMKRLGQASRQRVIGPVSLPRQPPPSP